MKYVRLGQVDLKSCIGNRVNVVFLARDVTVRLQKDKVTKYIVFNMVDKDVIEEARIFGASERMIEFVKEGNTYNGMVDVKAYDKSSTGYSCIIYNMDISDIPSSYFLDWAENLDECRDIINNVITNIYDTYYGKIAYNIIYKYWEKFSKWTAASSMHHTQLGGLLSHTADVVSIADKLSDYFNEAYGESFVNKPLLLCSAILHDIGKIFELDVNQNSGKTEYSQHSLLSSHIMDILQLVDEAAYELGYGRLDTYEEEAKSEEELEDEIEALNLLRHCLAAHHGKLEYGSPITASVPEAVLLHVADNLSADMYRYNKYFKNIDPGDSCSEWAGGQLLKFYKDSSKIGEINIDN